jgi:transcriptional antiterminator RfaH
LFRISNFEFRIFHPRITHHASRLTTMHSSSSSPQDHWYCLRSQPKHEHIAAAHLSQEPGLEVYLPRIRFKRSTHRGPVWFTEALFPSYLFARFNLVTAARRVHSARGVRGIVHFGDQWPQIADHVIAELRATVGADQVHVLDQELRPGEEVLISGGAFHNLKAVVTRVLPARQRIAVLLDFLGRQTMTEVSPDSVVRTENARKLAL